MLSLKRPRFWVACILALTVAACGDDSSSPSGDGGTDGGAGSDAHVDGGGATALSITTTTLPDATPRRPYSATLAATGGTTPCTWSLSSGSLPPGLGLSSNGTISGITNMAGVFSFTVVVTDASSPLEAAARNFSITSTNAPLMITTASLPGATEQSRTDQPWPGAAATCPTPGPSSQGACPRGSR